MRILKKDKLIKLKNYSTTVPAERSISEIQNMLIQFGAENIMLEAENKQVSCIKFIYRINDRLLPFKLPVNVENTTTVIWNDYCKSRRRGRKNREDFSDEAYRVGWRIARDWVHAQLSILAIEAVRFEEIFFGYLMMDNNQTISEKFISGELQKLLPEFNKG